MPLSTNSERLSQATKLRVFQLENFATGSRCVISGFAGGSSLGAEKTHVLKTERLFHRSIRGLQACSKNISSHEK